MLENEASLLTWRLNARPDQSARQRAEPLAPHRPHYLEYEGPVSGNRGRVSQWEAGRFRWGARQENLVAVRLLGTSARGHLLDGWATLTREDVGDWTFRYIRVQNECGRR